MIWQDENVGAFVHQEAFWKIEPNTFLNTTSKL